MNIKSIKIISILSLLSLVGCVPLAIGTGAGYIAAQSGPALSDAEITTKVKMKLLATQGIESNSIHVSTDRGVVTLAGHQSSQKMYDKALRVTQQVSDIKKIENHMKIF